MTGIESGAAGFGQGGNALGRDNYLNHERGIKSWLLTRDHKRIGVMYLVVILSSFFLGGIFAELIRTKLLTPGNSALMTAKTYDQMFTLHGAIMIFLFVIPGIPASLGNFVLPLMLGAKDVAFPRLNLASFYLWVGGATLALGSMVTGAVDTGWTFYTPYSTTTNTNVIMMVAGIFVLGFSSIFTGLNFVVTIHKLRPAGMTWFRMPLFLWGIYGTAIIQIMATPVLGITLLLLIAELSFLVWGHHMFVAGQSTLSSMIFSFLTFMVAIPSAVKVFNWLATMYKGSIWLATPMLYVLSFLFLFGIGGLTGLFLGALAVDVHLHDTYFVVAHFHYVMFGGTVIAFLGGLHYWWPKMFGRMYSEFWGRIGALLVFVGFNTTFFTQFVMGSHGAPRRSYNYQPQFEAYHRLSTIGAYILGVGFVVIAVYLIHSLLRGRPAPANPWGGATLEWQASSPPPHDNFESTPAVGDPYDVEAWTWDGAVGGFVRRAPAGQPAGS